MTVAAVVQPNPLIAPPTVSLLAAAVIVDEIDERWVNGLTYVPESCGASQVFDICDNDPTDGFQKDSDDASAPITGTPYGIVAQDTCTTFSYKSRDYEARANRLLLATESYQVAKELWEGNLGLNPSFKHSPSTTVATGVALHDAIGTIEAAFYTASPAQRLMLHLSPFLLERIQSELSAGVLARNGNIWYTAMDSVIAVDKGYPGTGPGGASGQWIFATPIVTVRHSAVTHIPSNLSEAVLRRQNEVTFYAERAVQTTWDYNCSLLAISVNVT